LEISNSGNLPLTTSPIMTPTVVPTASEAKQQCTPSGI
jgi:hypothetical protein